MSKELEAIKIKIEEAYKQLWHEREYAYDSKVCSKGKGWAEAIQHYDNIGRNLLEVKRILDDLLTKYEAIDNAEPSEALEELNRIDCNITYLLSDCDINEEVSMNFNSIRDNKSCEIIKQALLKTQEPKQYLKWEDLEFKEERQTIKVRMGNTIYNLFFYKFNYSSYKRCHLCNEEETLIYDIQEQFFNDLHLERVEE